MNVTNFQEIWQIDISGEIYEASFEIMAQWIHEGSLLPQDKVRRGNLRWIEAQKVPSLIQFFNAKAQGLSVPIFATTTEDKVTENHQIIQNQNVIPPPDFNSNPYQTSIVQPGQQYQTTINQPPAQESEITDQNTQNYQTTLEQPTQNYQTTVEQAPQNYQTNIVNPQTFNTVEPPTENPFTKQNHSEPSANSCAMHGDLEIAYFCQTCGNGFCHQCPKSFGGTVKICPFCGSMCEPIKKLQEKSTATNEFRTAITKGFGFDDLINAITYPFKFKTSLIAGAILFMFFTLGKSVGSFGMSFMLMSAAIICGMMANTLTFGILANTVENFSQGKINLNFMPSFDDFSLWDDVVHPFFLMVGTYIVSFGLLAVFIAGLVYFTWTTFNGEQRTSLEDKIAAAQKDREDRINKDKLEFQKQHPELYPEAGGETEIDRIQKRVQEQRQKEIEAATGKTLEQENEDKREMLTNFKNLGIPAVSVAFLLLLWGLFYYPAACLVAGYTRSFKATLNPSIGWETIRLLGFDYIKLLLMCIFLTGFIFLINIGLALLFSPFNLPSVGNIPATVVGAIFLFYFSIVFAVILGSVLYKNSEKLRLFRS